MNDASGGLTGESTANTATTVALAWHTARGTAAHAQHEPKSDVAQRPAAGCSGARASVSWSRLGWADPAPEERQLVARTHVGVESVP